MWRAGLTIFCSLLLVQVESAEVFSDQELSVIRSLSIENRPPLITDPARVTLGSALFETTRLSPSGRSCAACHPNGGTRADPEPFRAPRMRRSPVLADVAWNRWYFSDGRSTSLETAILEPLLHKQEVGATPGTIKSAYASDSLLASLFDAAAGRQRADRLTENELTELVILSLADYLRTVRSSQSRFDRFAQSSVGSTKGHLNDQEMRGLKIFLGKGNCVSCHNGWRFSDGEFHNLRLLDADGRVPTDSGRLGAISAIKKSANAAQVRKFTPEAVTNIVPYLSERGDQFGQFKTPGLRNLQDGAPLMHQGQFRSLRDAVLHYSEFSRSYPGHGSHDLLLQPLHLSSFEVDDLVAFLKSLQSEGVYK